MRFHSEKFVPHVQNYIHHPYLLGKRRGHKYVFWHNKHMHVMLCKCLCKVLGIQGLVTFGTNFENTQATLVREMN